MACNDDSVRTSDEFSTKVRELVEQAHAAGVNPTIISSALVYELTAEIAFGTITEMGRYNEAACLFVIDEFAKNAKDQIRAFGPRRHQ